MIWNIFCKDSESDLECYIGILAHRAKIYLFPRLIPIVIDVGG